MISRRGFVAGAVLAPTAAFAQDGGLASHCIGAIRGALAALPPGPVLLTSYIVETGAAAGDFDVTQANAAYVYDNALAGLALLAAGYRDDAARIGDALEIAQGHDRFWRDGRLRDAYQAGVMSVPARLPGWWDKDSNRWAEDPYQVGSQTGPLAWAMLLWAALGRAGPADRAAGWLNARLRAPAGYYGGFYGFEPEPLKLTWKSTEQNTDLFTAFTRLGRAADAVHARHFVDTMYRSAQSQFDAGTAPDGAPNPLLAADAGTWPYLAGLGSAGSALAAIAGLERGDGIGFSTASETFWPEGTAFAALALRIANDRRSAGYLASIARQISPQGYVYAASTARISTGFAVGPPPPGQPPVAFNYYRRPALAPTAWAAMAAMGYNPLST